ncbi:hypothetical protein ATETN484_0005005300 [Aspergillus terreus]|nr:hypothetical protein ATETN484_0005005300 [Aspergillus terreus]
MPLETSYTTDPRRQSRGGVKKTVVKQRPADTTEEPHDSEKLEHTAKPFEIQSQSPSGRAHAGEVSRRTERQTSALPPPEVPRQEGRTPPNTSSRRRRRATAPGDGSNSDSDSDDDDRKGKSGPGEGMGAIRQGKRPAQITPDHLQEKMDEGSHLLHEEDDLRNFKYMQQMLRWLEGYRAQTKQGSDVTSQQRKLLQEGPPSGLSGAVRSEISDIMLQYVDKFDQAVFDDSMATFMRQNDPSHPISGTAETSSHKFKSYFRRILRSGQVKYEFVEVAGPIPDFALKLIDTSLMELCRRRYSPVFRVLIKDNRPMHAELVSPYLLQDLGWRWKWKLSEQDFYCSHSNSCNGHWWRYQRGATKFTYNSVFRVRMTGETDSIWSSADDDPRFQLFLDEHLAAKQQEEEKDLDIMSDPAENNLD